MFSPINQEPNKVNEKVNTNQTLFSKAALLLAKGRSKESLEILESLDFKEANYLKAKITNSLVFYAKSDSINSLIFIINHSLENCNHILAIESCKNLLKRDIPPITISNTLFSLASAYYHSGYYSKSSEILIELFQYKPNHILGLQLLDLLGKKDYSKRIVKSSVYYPISLEPIQVEVNVNIQWPQFADQLISLYQLMYSKQDIDLYSAPVTTQILFNLVGEMEEIVLVPQIEEPKTIEPAAIIENTKRKSQVEFIDRFPKRSRVAATDGDDFTLLYSLIPENITNSIDCLVSNSDSHFPEPRVNKIDRNKTLKRVRFSLDDSCFSSVSSVSVAEFIDSSRDNSGILHILRNILILLIPNFDNKSATSCSLILQILETHNCGLQFLKNHDLQFLMTCMELLFYTLKGSWNRDALFTNSLENTFLKYWHHINQNLNSNDLKSRWFWINAHFDRIREKYSDSISNFESCKSFIVNSTTSPFSHQISLESVDYNIKLLNSRALLATDFDSPESVSLCASILIPTINASQEIQDASLYFYNDLNIVKRCALRSSIKRKLDKSDSTRLEIVEFIDVIVNDNGTDESLTMVFLIYIG